MSRSGYIDDSDTWASIRWRGAVASAIRGGRGQAFFKELLVALDAMPEKRLITNVLKADGAFCTLGVLGAARGIDIDKIDPENPEEVASEFNIAAALAQEVVYMNDEYGSYWGNETPEERWKRMREWIASQIKEAA